MRAAALRGALICGLGGVAMSGSGCMLEVGESGLEAELARSHARDGFHLVSASPHRAVIAARGREVVIRPGNGSCIARNAIDLSERSAFLLMTDCALELDETPDATVEAGTDGAPRRLHLKRSFPGLITVSVSGEGRSRLDRLSRFLETPEGRAQLGRGAAVEEVEILELRERDGVLLVLARDLDEAALPLLSRAFWRGFAEVNGRLVVVTVSGFRANAIGTEAMLAELVAQVDALSAGRSLPEEGDEAPAETATDAPDVAAEVPEIAVDTVTEEEAAIGEFAPEAAPRPPRPSRRAGA
ncbi:MAG: hypothetical protein AAFV49_03225 [Pseudomonadota bacterium]